MDTRRWSTLLVFAGGCLTGALLLALNIDDGESRPLARATEPAQQLAKLGPGSAAPAPPAALGAREASAMAQADTAAPTPVPAEPGNSVADVLTRLEAEYRQRATPQATEKSAPLAKVAPAPAAANEVTKEGSEEALTDSARPPAESAREVKAPRLAMRDEPVAARAPTSMSEQAPPEAPSAARESSQSSTVAAETELASVGSASSDESGARQVTAQIQQLTLMQQATLAQQSAVLQYLQLLALTAPSRPTRSAWSARPRGTGGRIVATLPSSISDSDNPWGFELQPSVLVH